MELREKIARACFFRGDEADETQWKHMQERHRVVAYEQADAVLAIPELQEALESRQEQIEDAGTRYLTGDELQAVQREKNAQLRNALGHSIKVRST